MTDIHSEIINHPSTWKSSDFDGPDDVAFDFEERHRDALRGVVARAKAAGRGLQELTDAETGMPEIEDGLLDLRNELMDGRGLLLGRGWPLDEMTDEELAIAYWALGTYFGRGVSQRPRDDRLGYVTDVSKPGTQERGYRNAKELNLHTDSDDIVGLLCVRQGKSGGLARLASAMTVHNIIIIAAEYPHLLPLLHEGFHHSWTDARPPGEGPVMSLKVPVFSWTDGAFVVCHLRARVDLACQETGTTLSDLEREALDTFDAVANRPGVILEFRLEPGTASFINNYTMLHSRIGFEDWPEAGAQAPSAAPLTSGAPGAARPSRHQALLR